MLPVVFRRVLSRPRVLLHIFMSLIQLSQAARGTRLAARRQASRGSVCPSVHTDTVDSTDSWCVDGPACKCVGGAFLQLSLPNHTACLHLIATSGLETLTPGLFSRLTRLRKLTLERCGVRAIAPNAFDGLLQLRRFSIFTNKISILPTGNETWQY